MTSERIPYTQAGRMMAVSTPLGGDVLLIERLVIEEGINALFAMEAAVKSQRDDLAAGDLIGASVDFRLKLKDEGTRWWNGFVTALHESSFTTRGTRAYALTVRPKLWTLGQKADCRIFRNTTSVQIVETLCQEHGISDLDMRVTGQPPSHDYSVQWNETDLAYMLRRMEQDGLFYWFEQAEGRHTLVVADHASGYRAAPELTVRFAEGSAAQDHITQWNRRFAFTSGKRAGRDWNFLTMATPEGDETTLATVPGNAAAELYEYPGLFDDTNAAEQAMRYRIQATETGYETVEAASTVRTLAPGLTFTPQDKAKPGNGFASQVITSIRHDAVDRSYETSAGRPSYDNTFAAVPATTPLTPHRTVPRPTVTGSQVALIAGPAGEEIFCDQWGRVKVWFPWDRRAKKDGSDTCWLRVGQPWAGSTWGHQVIPRVGMEAVISYHHGDPDRPFVLALLPDPTNPTPYKLPDNKTRMTFRSNSYKSQGFNEMTFEDATGAENMFFHAQKDHTTKVENNQTNSVGANHANVVGQNQALTVGANQTQEVGGSANLTVGGTGAGASALMAPLSNLSGQTAGMLGAALQAAASATGAATGGGAGAAGSVASALSGLAGGAGGGGFAGGLLGMAMGAAGSGGGAGAMLPQLASSLIGILGSTGQQAQGQVGNGPSPRPDAGTALASAGGQLGQAAGNLFPQGGVLNTIVGLMRTDSVGMAHAMQVGTSQVVNIGQTAMENVGKAKKIKVGQELIIEVGKSSLTMRSDGTVIILGTNFNFTASGPVQINGEVIDLNKPGS